MGRLIALAAEPDRPCADVDAIARKHLAAINEKIGRLNSLRAEVRRMLKACARAKVAECKVIDVLAHHGKCRHEKH